MGWQDMVPGAGEGTVYEVAGGRVADLAVDGGFEAASCTRRHVPSVEVPDPPRGQVVYRLIRAFNSCSDSGWGDRSGVLPCS